MKHKIPLIWGKSNGHIIPWRGEMHIKTNAAQLNDVARSAYDDTMVPNVEHIIERYQHMTIDVDGIQTDVMVPEGMTAEKVLDRLIRCAIVNAKET